MTAATLTSDTASTATPSAVDSDDESALRIELAPASAATAFAYDTVARTIRLAALTAMVISSGDTLRKVARPCVNPAASNDSNVASIDTARLTWNTAICRYAQR